MAGPRGDRKGRVGPRLGRADPHRDPLLHHEPEDVSQGDFLKAVRNHWAIENQLHWVLDVQLREDDLRNRAGYGPENLAGVRRLVVNIVRFMEDKLSFRRRLLRAAQDPEYRLELIANAAKLAEAL